MSKRIVRLSESQLRDMIKRVVNEQSAPMAKPAAQPAQQSAANDPDYKKAWGVIGLLMDAIEGVGTKEPQVLKAVQSIGTKRVYDYLLQIVQKSPTVKQKTGRNYKLVMEYIMLDFQFPIVDKPIHSSLNYMPGTGKEVEPSTSSFGFGADGYNNSSATNVSKQCARILGGFNENEFEPFSKGTERQSY